MNKNEPMYRHLRVTRGQGIGSNFGAVTLSYTKKKHGMVDVGVAFCSPKDQFCKGVGRDIADQDSGTHELYCPDLHKYGQRDLMAVVRVLSSGNYPSWSKGILEMYIEQYTDGMYDNLVVN